MKIDLTNAELAILVMSGGGREKDAVVNKIRRYLDTTKDKCRVCGSFDDLQYYKDGKLPICKLCAKRS